MLKISLLFKKFANLRGNKSRILRIKFLCEHRHIQRFSNLHYVNFINQRMINSFLDKKNLFLAKKEAKKNTANLFF